MMSPHIERTSGSVEIGTGEPPAWRPARAGDSLAPGDAVRTGRDGRAEVALPAGSVRLYGDSLLRLPVVADGVDAVELDSGSSLFDVLRRRDDGFEVRTPEVVVSIKGTRFLVATGERPEVAVFHGTVGLREMHERAHELLVREGFTAVGGGAGGSFELMWSGAPDPWEGWWDGGAPPLVPESAAIRARERALGVESAKAAARDSARREAVEQALDRHPQLAERVQKALESQKETGRGKDADGMPAAPDPDPIVDAPRDTGQPMLQEHYVEALLNGSPAGGGGGPGPSFDVTLEGETVQIASGGLSWIFDEDELEDIAEGESSFPQPLDQTLGALGQTSQSLAEQLLGMLDDDDGDDD
jgi:ferric-dicitrate binding protein FerR (iron transport regulator)